MELLLTISKFSISYKDFDQLKKGIFLGILYFSSASYLVEYLKEMACAEKR